MKKAPPKTRTKAAKAKREKLTPFTDEQKQIMAYEFSKHQGVGESDHVGKTAQSIIDAARNGKKGYAFFESLNAEAFGNFMSNKEEVRAAFQKIKRECLSEGRILFVPGLVASGVGAQEQTVGLEVLTVANNSETGGARAFQLFLDSEKQVSVVLNLGRAESEKLLSRTTIVRRDFSLSTESGIHLGYGSEDLLHDKSLSAKIHARLAPAGGAECFGLPLLNMSDLRAGSGAAGRN